MSPDVGERGVTVTGVWERWRKSESHTGASPWTALEDSSNLNTGTQLWLGSSVDLCNICSKGEKSTCVCKGSYAKLPTASSDWKGPTCPRRCAKRPKLLCFCPMEQSFTIKTHSFVLEMDQWLRHLPPSLRAWIQFPGAAWWKDRVSFLKVSSVLHPHALTNMCLHTYTYDTCSELSTWPGM